MILETKYDIGQEVYFLNDQKIKKGVIDCLKINGVYSEQISPFNEIYTVDCLAENGSKQKLLLSRNELFESPEDLAECLLNEYLNNS